MSRMLGAVVCSAAKHCLKTLYEWVEAAWQIREEESRRRCKLAGAAVAQGQAGAVAWEECRYGDYCWQPVCRVLGDVDVMDGYWGKGACLTVWGRELHTRHAIPCNKQCLWQHKTTAYSQARMPYESGTDRGAHCNQRVGILWITQMRWGCWPHMWE